MYPKAVETQGNIGVRAEPDKSMYHFCLHEEGEPPVSRSVQ